MTIFWRPKGCVLWFDFAEMQGDTVYDLSGNDNNGTRYGATWGRGPLIGVLSHDGVDDYTVVEPFTVYGWSEITIEELVYMVSPKPNGLYSKTGMIGDPWVDYPSTYFITPNAMEYDNFRVVWNTRKPDGTSRYYGYAVVDYVNKWVYIARRFTADREYSVWLNGEEKYSATVPSDEKTVLEWDPDMATYPERYKRFILAAGTRISEFLSCKHGLLRIYNRALTDEEIKENYRYLMWRAKQAVPSRFVPRGLRV